MLKTPPFMLSGPCVSKKRYDDRSEEQFRNRIFNVLILASLSQLRCKVAELAKRLGQDPGYADRPGSAGVRDHVAPMKLLLKMRIGLAEKIGLTPENFASRPGFALYGKMLELI